MKPKQRRSCYRWFMKSCVAWQRTNWLMNRRDRLCSRPPLSTKRVDTLEALGFLNDVIARVEAGEL